MNAAIDITPAHRKTILALLRQYLPGVLVWAYGSRVKWTSRPASDLDLVAFSKPEQSRQVAALEEAFEESSLPFRIDLHVWDEVPERFRSNIEKEFVVLQEAKQPESGSGVVGDRRLRPLGELTENLDNIRVPVKERDRRPGPYPYYGASGIVTT